MIDMSESWIGRGELGARTARAEQHDLSSRDRLDDPLTDLVPYVNEHWRRVAELQRGEVAAVAGDRGAEHERLDRLGARFVVRVVFARHSIWCGRRRSVRREQVVLDCGLD